MIRRWPRFLVLLFAATLVVVGVQTVWPVIPQGKKLYGVTEDPKPITWSRKEFLNGGLAHALDIWFDAHVGFRNFWVQLDNQVSYTLFGQVNPRTDGTQIVAGAHDWLFEYQYIETAVKPLLPGGITDDDLRRRVDKLHSVQEKLARRGIPLLVVVAPSKVEVYPEHVPARYFVGRDPAAVTTNFERARPLFEAAGINFYDGPKRYAEWKAAGERNLFARSGTHWSYISALRVLQEIRERLNPVLRHPMPELKVAATPVGPPHLIDQDLLEGLNLLVDRPYQHPLPYPELKPQTEVPVEQLPHILWVHDSFGWVLFDLLYQAKAVQPSEAFFYFKTGHLLPEELKPDLDPDKIDDWETFLKSYDAVVIVWTEIAFDFDAWGFIDKLDSTLK